MKFELQNQDDHARTGLLKTAHGEVHTPVFMPVGTYGAVKSLAPKELEETNFEIILGNTFHLWLRPGLDVIKKHKGLHEFISWNNPILTDSGGFQVWSLGKMRKISEAGVTFRSPINGDEKFMGPEESMKIQKILNSDIAMIFDECTPYPATYDEAKKSMLLSNDWAYRSKVSFEGSKNALFGIIQGGMFKDLREESLKELTSIGFDGYAIGGLSVGEPKEEMAKITNFIGPKMPIEKPRYLMGVGTPEDILNAIENGIDMFDCVMPTRNARNGTLFTSFGRINIRKACFVEDEKPIDPACECYTCQNYSRGYLNHLYKSGEMSYFRLASIHNLHYYLNLMRECREAILNNNWVEYKKDFYDKRAK